MKITPLTKAGFAFEGWIPEDHIILPDFYRKYPQNWCFRVECFGCNLECIYCYNKPYLDDDVFICEYDLIERARSICDKINTFSYTIGEPGLFIEDIKKTIERYPSDEFRHCVKTNGQFICNDLIEDLYAINTDIKGLDQFYLQYTTSSNFVENILIPHLNWLSDIVIPEKEITYAIWLWKNDDEQTKEFVLEWVDKIGARLCLNIVRSTADFDCGYKYTDIKEDFETLKRICDIYDWFKQYGIEPFMCNFKHFDELYEYIRQCEQY